MRKKIVSSILNLKNAADKHYEAANDALDRENFILALTHIGDARRLEPFNADNRMLLGDAYYEMGLYRRALDTDMSLLAMVACTEKPTFDYVFGCIRALIAMGEKQAALHYLEFAMENCPDATEVYGNLYGDEIRGMMMSIDKENSEYTMVNTVDDELETLDIVRRFIKYEEFALALETLDKFESTAKNYLLSRALKAECLWQNGDEKTAKQLAQSLAEEYGDNALILSELAHIYYLTGKSAASKDVVEKINYNGEDVVTLYFVSRAYAECGEYERALRAIDTALRHYPYETELLMMQAVICSNMGRMDEASNVLMTILAIDPMDTVAMYHNGRLQEGVELPLDPYSLPTEEIKERVEWVYEMASMDKKEFMKAGALQYNVAIVRYCLLYDFLTDGDVYDVLFALGESPQIEIMYRELAAVVYTPIHIKNLIGAVMAYSWRNDLCLSVGYMMQKVSCRMPTNAKKRDNYLRAWTYSLASLAQCAKKYETKLKRVFAKLIDAEYEPKSSPKQIAAAVNVMMVTQFREEIVVFNPSAAVIGLLDDMNELETVMREMMPLFFSTQILDERHLSIKE